MRTSGEPQTEGEGADEEVVRVRGTLQDITDRKRRERALEDRQNKVEALYEATEHLLRAEREEEVARYLVTLVGRTLGYPGTTIRFARNGQLLPSKVSSMVRHHMPERPVYDIDGTSPAARAYRKGETLFYEDLSAEQDTLDRGEIRATAYVPMGSHGLISVGSLEVGGIDAFDRHLIEVLAAYASVVLNRLDREEALREAKDEAEEADRMKSVFLANLSHEIRTPLTSIIGFAEAIGDEMAHLDSPSSPDDEDALNLSALSRFAGLIRESGERLLGTLDGVLNLSKLEAGEMGLVAEPVDVAATVRAIAQEFEPQAEAAGVELTADPPDGAIWVRGDEEGIEMILRNLVSNALKYTEEGGRVWVRAREATEQDEAVLIEVEDTGVGIDEDDIDTLFEPFRQASEGMGRRYEGTGLGLTITRKATREMEGSIEVETEKGEGSRFVVRLPGADAADGSSGSSAQAA